MITLFGNILSKFLGQERLNRIDPLKLGFAYFALLFICFTFTFFLAIKFHSLLSWPPEKGHEGGHYQNIYPEQPKFTTIGITCSEENLTGKCEESDAGNPTDNEEKANEFIKNLRDLNAQEGMWRSANALVLLTLIQAIIVAMSLYYLRQTLAATDRTAQAAENAERAFIVIEPVCKLDDSDKSRFKFHIQLVNYGRTPALSTRFTSRFKQKASQTPIAYLPVAPLIGAGIDQKHIIESTVVEGRIADYLEITPEPKRNYLAGKASCKYTDIFNLPRDSVDAHYTIEFGFADNHRRVWQDDSLVGYEFSELEINGWHEGLTDAEIDSRIAEEIKYVRISY